MLCLYVCCENCVASVPWCAHNKFNLLNTLDSVCLIVCNVVANATNKRGYLVRHRDEETWSDKQMRLLSAASRWGSSGDPSIQTGDGDPNFHSPKSEAIYIILL